MPEIRPINRAEVNEAISVIAAAVQSVYGQGEPTADALAAVRENLVCSGALDDLKDLAGEYEQKGGAFLVLADHGRIVGTGSIKRLDDGVCELGRLWFLPAYRGRGLGRRMAEQLLGFARQHGYERVRLDTTEKCVDAIALFRKLGFRQIDRYKPGPNTLFMELALTAYPKTAPGTPARGSAS